MKVALFPAIVDEVPDEASNAHEIFREEFLPRLTTVGQAFLNDVKSQTESERVRAGYKMSGEMGSISISVIIENTSWLWPLLENDVSPHFPPWDPESTLANWAIQRGLSPFVIARSISRKGMVGNHIVANTQPAYRQKFDEAVREANTAYMWRAWGKIR